MKPRKWRRRKTSATPAWIPRSRASETRRERKQNRWIRMAVAAISDFTRMKMKEESIGRKIFLPTETNNA